jgi:hypothetical protein
MIIIQSRMAGMNGNFRGLKGQESVAQAEASKR